MFLTFVASETELPRTAFHPTDRQPTAATMPSLATAPGLKDLR